MHLDKKQLVYELNDADPRDKKKGIQHLFDAIVPTYDLLNRMLSLGIDQIWRRQAVNRLDPLRNRKILDICCGTGDLSRVLRQKGARTFSLDFSREMIARGKATNRLGSRTIAGDAARLPIKDRAFDGAAIAFGIRNIPDLNFFLEEVKRILAPGGRLIVLELVRPQNPLVKILYDVYLKGYLPIIGRLVSGNDHAYAYLAGTISTFIDLPSLKTMIFDHGFRDIHISTKSAGIAAVIMATRDGT